MSNIACRSIRFASVLSAALTVAIAGCSEDAESPTEPRLQPALATTATQALVFRQVSAGHFHTCGVTSDNRAYCWGANFSGQLGDGTNTQRLRPMAVAGGLNFRQVLAGARDRYGTSHSCGVTTSYQGYCWGGNDEGQLGDGTTTQRLKPRAVAGGLQFSGLIPGGDHTCAVTTASVAHCWGYDYYGQLGDGSPVGNAAPTRLSPFAVVGELALKAVTPGGTHTCALTTGNLAYCWGANAGQLGDGTTDWTSTPVPVAGPI
jgi:alpha-tubulin suppressor-like RCC1 family protein